MIHRTAVTRALTAALAGLAITLAAWTPQSADRHRGHEQCLSLGLRDLAAWRWVEPRLSGGFAWQPCRRGLANGRVVEEADCLAGHPEEPAVSMVGEGCDAASVTQVRAVRALVRNGDATEEAVEMLENLAAQAPADPLLLSDLAAAYLVRAQRSDLPEDLLHGLDMARRAVASAPLLPAARFNLALAEEALELPAGWQDYLRLDGSSPWAAEARQRRQRLARESARDEATSWSLNRERLPLALGVGDRQALAELVRPYPAAAQRYLEEELLPAWARAVSGGRAAEAARRLADARTVAGELTGDTGDPYLADAVAVVARAAASPQEPAALQALAAGHFALERARSAQLRHHWPQAERQYRRAGRWLTVAASPMREGADLGLALALYQRGGVGSLARVLRRLEPVERESRARGYRYLLGRASWIRGLCLGFQGHAVESLAAYRDALADFTAMDDREDEANVRARMAGVLREVGDGDLAWREIVSALPQLPRMVDLQSRHYLLGEAAATVLSLGLPDAALLYQERAVAMIEEGLRSATLAKHLAEVENLQLQRAIGLRWRAAIEVQAGMHAESARDLDLAAALAKKPTDPHVRQDLENAVRQVGALLWASSKPELAIGAWQAALRESPAAEDRFFRASIDYQLALAYLTLHRRSDAEHQLKQGIEDLRAQEKTILSGRRPGEGEALWSACFSRFQAEYRLLIRMLAEDGDQAAAFDYAEKARAFEPLDLVLRSPSTPRVFRRLAADREPMALAEIQRHLPRDTFLVESCVLDDRVLTWVVWRGGFAPLAQPVGRKALERWARTLADSAQQRDEEAFRQGLNNPLGAAVTAPLAMVRRALRGRNGLVVFVADGPLQGLPIAALRDAATGRRVVEDHAVALAPSATLYVYSVMRDSKVPLEARPAALLMSGPAAGGPFGMVDAPGPWNAQREVRRIAELYPGSSPLLDQAADRFLAAAGASAVVHFAGHSFSDPRYLFRSFLLFAPSARRSGALYADEILRRLRLRKTRLVVLSACASAGGGPIGPEGLAPLVRPLLAVGAPAVVGSLWQVGPGTEELMVRFHLHYAAGEDAAHALRQAQLDLEAGPLLDWASFELIGFARPPFPISGKIRRDPS